MQQTDAEKLLERYHAGIATEEEKALVETWYLQKAPSSAEIPDGQLVSDKMESLDLLLMDIQPERRIRIWPRIAAAASIVLCLSVSGYFLFRQQPARLIVGHQVQQDIAPGSNKATITLANGKQIAITDAKNGLLANQGNTAIRLRPDGEVVYQAAGSATALQYNTMTTPRGGQYPLVLSDGTKVWLDAASSITYPVAFTGNDRQVKITGQVYFEVAHNAAMPFKVTANEQTIEVLGTHFNINAYTDEPVMKTTLFEGSVKISGDGNSTVLKPGQQARNDRHRISVINHADLDEAIAWHKGLFKFDEADIQTVMRQLSRWYDVDISYEGEIPDVKFSGEIYRNITALKVSDILSYEKIHFRIEGKKIIVMP